MDLLLAERIMVRTMEWCRRLVKEGEGWVLCSVALG